MRTIETGVDRGRRPRVLLALLAGSLSAPEDLVREGFPDAVRAHGVDAELVMGETRAAWFADGSMVERIEDAVVAPARGRGHTRIWLAGISLGGLAAICYAARHDGELEGLALISPYPATREVLREVEAAGGPGEWQPEIPPEGDLEREAWRWLADGGAQRASVHCYIATGDRFVDGQRRMASTLDPAHVHELPGGHDWPAWRALWDAFLADTKASLQ
jgi:pimeloyl-ACP methyl ester carboxylesterase